MSSDNPSRDDPHSQPNDIRIEDTHLTERQVIAALTTPDGARHHGLDALADTYADVSALLQTLNGHGADLEAANTRIDAVRLASELESFREDLIEHAATEHTAKVGWTLDGYTAAGYEAALDDGGDGDAA